MSGIYFIVEAEGTKPDTSPLQATKGGYPHITLVYTGKRLFPIFLSSVASNCMRDLLNESNGQLPTFTLTKEAAKVNEFFEERTGKQRYDVLLGLSQSDQMTIQELRMNYKLVRTTFSTHPPHVTHSIHYSQAAADKALSKIKGMLPMVVRMTGVTID